MIVNLFVKVKNKNTGELNGYLTSIGTNTLVIQDDMVEMDFETHKDKLTQNLNEAFVYQGGELISLPPRQHPYQEMNFATRQWQDPRTLQDLKSAKWAEVKKKRDAAEFANFIYDGMEFDGDMDAMRRLGTYISVSKSALAAGRPFSAQFTLANNAEVTLTASDFTGIEMAKVQAVAMAFAHGVALRAAIDAADADGLQEISW